MTACLLVKPITDEGYDVHCAYSSTYYHMEDGREKGKASIMISLICMRDQRYLPVVQSRYLTFVTCTIR